MRKIIFISLISFFLACESYVEIDVPPIMQKPVLSCLFTENKPFKLRLAMSADMNDTALNFINNAVVSLYGNGVFIEQLQELDSGKYVSNCIAKRGVMYRIEAQIDGFLPLSASDSLPEQVFAQTIYYQKNAIYDFGNFYAQANIIFQDPPGDNYYEVSLSAEYNYYSNWDSVYHTVFINDNIAYWLINDDAVNAENPTGWIGSINFKDEYFDGKKYRLRLPVEKMPDNAQHYIRFNTVSYHYYKYKSTMDKHLFNQGGWSDDDLLIIEGGNPVQMYSNVENGYGIFAGYIPHLIEVKDIRE
jgi:hypothetical protein